MHASLKGFLNSCPVARFTCDAMLGGLARWLRAAGYDAAWQVDIRDRDLIRQAGQDKRILLTSDSGIFQFALVRDGKVPALFIPRGLGVEGQLIFVLGQLILEIRDPFCMVCGGKLIAVPKEQVEGRVPPRSFGWKDQFWECDSCGQIFWRGTHWQAISQKLRKASRRNP